MVITKSIGLTTVSSFLALLFGQQENTLRQRLREFYREAEAKKGKRRRELDVRSCFPSLMNWILSLWPAQQQRMALALDATTPGERFRVLVISVVYRGCAISVAWEVVRANTKGAWKELWLSMLDRLIDTIPKQWEVIVLADRGLYASWLFRKIVSLGWHPLLRINGNGRFCEHGKDEYRLLESLLPGVGSSYAARGRCFKSQPLECTVLGQWKEGYDGPWILVTDLSPQEAVCRWYAMRSWIECGFKHTKRGGWQWQNTKMINPERAARLWLAIAVATLWVVSVGSDSEHGQGRTNTQELPTEQECGSPLPKKTASHTKLFPTRYTQNCRVLSNRSENTSWKVETGALARAR